MRVHVYLHGQHGNVDFEVDVDTAREAIEALGTQFRPFDHLPLGQRPVIRVVGFPTREDIEGPLPADVTELHLIPAMFGGGGKFGSFIVAAILVGISFIPGIGQAVAVGLRIAAITMAASGVVNLFMPTPKASAGGPQDPAASKYFGTNGNTVAIGTPIGLAYGRVPRFGHILALNVDAQDVVRGSFPASP